ncbi:hypothetical protein DIT68_03280 [Brumimicrobium oceani]|uniref:Uncharacterized protein n=1 Tax=Brumimicrobium oceani TaxID=2100725 RepID=A0A2U2XEQ3_9FLAO|nr:hypothetical protein DIT68_03280 [Brumimicrobium oceani]
MKKWRLLNKLFLDLFEKSRRSRLDFFVSGKSPAPSLFFCLNWLIARSQFYFQQIEKEIFLRMSLD